MGDLARWLARFEAEQTKNMSLDLSRISRTVTELGLKPLAPVFTVAGTNGKGSTCAYLEQILVAAGYRPLAFYSPHLLEFTERIRIDGKSVAEEEIVSCLEIAAAADEKRHGGKPMTYFEYVALAAVLAGNNAGCGAFVLEIGLGGRLDAINVFDPDVAIIVSVELDHMEYLGANREAIGMEKAGILRYRKPLVLGERQPPASVLARAKELKSPVKQLGVDFDVEVKRESWIYRGESTRVALPRPLMRGFHQFTNAACALAALECCNEEFSASQAEIRTGLNTAKLRGRFELVPDTIPPVILDVAHNAASARSLRSTLLDIGYYPKTHIVLGMRVRKDHEAFINELSRSASGWHLAPLSGAADEDGVGSLRAVVAKTEIPVQEHPSICEAVKGAADADADLVVVTGSFLAVEDYLRNLPNNKSG